MIYIPNCAIKVGYKAVKVLESIKSIAPKS